MEFAFVFALLCMLIYRFKVLFCDEWVASFKVMIIAKYKRKKKCIQYILLLLDSLDENRKENQSQMINVLGYFHF